jgi:hypothetical protein
MIRKTFFSLFLTVCLANCSFSIEPGDRIVVSLNGELVAGQIVELISADSKAVIKLIDGKTIIALTDDIAYGLPPLIDDSQVREWNIDKRENATIASFIRMKDDIVYLQKKDGIVISFQTKEISQPDLSFAREKSRSQSKVLLSAGEYVTKPPFSLPAGEEGEKILREAEVFVFPFLRSVALSPRFEMAK